MKHLLAHLIEGRRSAYQALRDLTLAATVRALKTGPKGGKANRPRGGKLHAAPRSCRTAGFDSNIVPLLADELEMELATRCSQGRVEETEYFSLEFLRQYQDSGLTSQQAIELAIRCTHKPTELQHFLFRVFHSHFEKENRNTMQLFEKLFQGTQLLVLHVSCRPRLQLAIESSSTFKERLGVRNLIIVGEEASLSKYHFDPSKGIMTVPAPDTYEGLSKKMAVAYRFLAFCGVKTCVLKIDDDIHCVEDSFAPSQLIDLAKEHDYLGRVNDSLSGIYRWWHFGKCKSEELNASPYSMIGAASYANGPAYMLSPRSVRVLGKSSIYLCQSFEAEMMFEDIAVGKILNHFNIYPHHYDFLSNGIVLEKG